MITNKTSQSFAKCIFTLLASCNLTVAQININQMGLGEIHGNFQANAQYYIPDSTIGAADVPERMLFNGFANILYTKGKFTAGLRYESYQNALQGYPVGFKGTGIPYRFITYHSDFLEITAGSGLIGKQRSFFSQRPGIVRGVDGEIQFNELFAKLADKKLSLGVGGVCGNVPASNGVTLTITSTF